MSVDIADIVTINKKITFNFSSGRGRKLQKIIIPKGKRGIVIDKNKKKDTVYVLLDDNSAFDFKVSDVALAPRISFSDAMGFLEEEINSRHYRDANNALYVNVKLYRWHYPEKLQSLIDRFSKVRDEVYEELYEWKIPDEIAFLEGEFEHVFNELDIIEIYRLGRSGGWLALVLDKDCTEYYMDYYDEYWPVNADEIDSLAATIRLMEEDPSLYSEILSERETLIKKAMAFEFLMENIRKRHKSFEEYLGTDECWEEFIERIESEYADELEDEDDEDEEKLVA